MPCYREENPRIMEASGAAATTPSCRRSREVVLAELFKKNKERWLETPPENGAAKNSTLMRHGYTSQNEGPDRNRHLPEFSQPQSAEADTTPRLSAFAGWEVQNAEREAAEELRKDADILGAVLAAQKQIAVARLDLEQSLAFIAEGAHRLTRTDGAAIALSDGEKTVCRARSGALAPELGAYLDPQSGICAHCLTSGEVQLCNDTEYDQRVNLSPNLGVRSVLAVPLRRQRDVLGIIVAFSAAPGVFCQHDVRALKLLAALVIDALWLNEAHAQPTTAPEPGESLQARQPLAGSISRAPADSRDGIACAVRLEPAAPASKVEEIRAQVEAAASPEAELSTPESAKSHRLRWSLAIIAGVIVALAATTEVRLWRGEHVRELLRHLKRAVSAASLTTTVLATTTAPDDFAALAEAAQTAPLVPSAPVPAAAPAQLLAVRSWSKPEGTTIAVFLQAPARWESGRLQDPERIYFDLDNTQVAGEMLTSSREGLAIQVNDGLVNNVHVRLRGASAVRIVIDPAAPAEYSAALSPAAPYRLMILVRSARAGSPMPSGNEGRALALRTALDHPKIVLDPGHGGNESGAIGHGGWKEKDLTLQICSKLRNLLASRLGAQVIFTRTGDLSVPLEERAAIANQVGADLLISVHVNSSGDAGTRGVETYYAEGGALMPAADEGNLSESRRLAVEVQRALYDAVGGDKNVPNRGVKQAPFVVLLDAKIPSVLAEVGFLTNPAEERNLATTAGQEAVADALYRGIADYLAAAGQGKAVSGNGQ